MKRLTFFASIAIAFAVGCQQKPSEITPPQVQYGQAPCEGCGMIVSDQRFAAAIVLEMPDGERRPAVFDDIGCMLDYEREHHDGKVLARFVKDVTTGRWVAADKANFVRGKSIQSPMASGIAATATVDAAEKFATDHNASVQTFAQINQAAPSSSQAAAQ
jgi:copper chaperone NosL